MFDAGTSQQLMTRTQGLRLFVGKCANRTSLEVRKRYGSLIKVRRITCGCVSRIPSDHNRVFIFAQVLSEWTTFQTDPWFCPARGTVFTLASVYAMAGYYSVSSLDADEPTPHWPTFFMIPGLSPSTQYGHCITFLGG